MLPPPARDRPRSRRRHLSSCAPCRVDSLHLDRARTHRLGRGRRIDRRASGARRRRRIRADDRQELLFLGGRGAFAWNERQFSATTDPPTRIRRSRDGTVRRSRLRPSSSRQRPEFLRLRSSRPWQAAGAFAVVLPGDGLRRQVHALHLPRSLAGHDRDAASVAQSVAAAGSATSPARRPAFGAEAPVPVSELLQHVLEQLERVEDVLARERSRRRRRCRRASAAMIARCSWSFRS